MSVQSWNAENYAREGRFVADMAGDVVRLLDAQAGERILDLGCGDGVLTQRLAESGAVLVGVDGAPAMVAAAQAHGVDARLCAAEQLNFLGEFDAVFSNAALHWVRDQDAMLSGVFKALRPGGRFVAEMGGHGNIAALRTALRAALVQVGKASLHAAEGLENYFPSPEAYRTRLAAHGFRVETMELFPRSTRLGSGGARGWYSTFRNGVLAALEEDIREQVLGFAEQLLAPVLRDEEGVWIADYVRLRFRALRVG
jgi:trans-aconitate methyltransferase